MQNLITIIAPQLLVAGAYSSIGEIKEVVFEASLDAGFYRCDDCGRLCSGYHRQRG